jgi:hypothetical protein
LSAGSLIAQVEIYVYFLAARDENVLRCHETAE